MKKIFMFIALGLLYLAGQAIPADPRPVQVTQPDGSTLTITLHGDEFFHFTTTSDGYTIVKNAAGFYTYARLDGDRLVAGNRIARDLSQRTAADMAALASIPKGLTDRVQASAGTQMLGRRNSAMRRVGADGMMDYDNFRGLIILINYSDKKFSMAEPGDFYDDMVNTHDYTGYTLNNRRVHMTGSVRDYYYDNSNHIFDPHFDVVGPVNVPYSCRYPQSTSRSDAIFYAALDSIDSEVDFSQYDTDGDGYVDMVFFLVAGFSANYGGNDESYLWPHMYYLFNAPAHDGVLFGLYACSTEIAGWEGFMCWVCPTCMTPTMRAAAVRAVTPGSGLSWPAAAATTLAATLWVTVCMSATRWALPRRNSSMRQVNMSCNRLIWAMLDIA